MKIRTLLFLLGHGITNLFRNRLMTIASITTISACIFVISLFYTIGTNIEYMMNSIESNIGIAVFFKPEAEESRILEIKSLLEARAEVSKVEYISPEKAWEAFKADYFEGHEEQLAGFDEDNPLKDSASLQVLLADIDYQIALVRYIESLPGVRHVRQTEEVTVVLQSFNRLVQYGSFVLVIILLLISVFLISNTIRLAITLRITEINIMKYIGAKDSFIKGPFIIEGAIIGLVGTFLPLALIYIFYNDVIISVKEEYALLSNFLVFMDIKDVYQTLVPVTLLIGIVIGLVGSMLTVSKHLKV